MISSEITPLLDKVLIKISGEFLAGKQHFGIDPSTLSTIAETISKLHTEGREISIVIGGGNFFRGVAIAAKGMDRVAGDYLGMLLSLIHI